MQTQEIQTRKTSDLKKTDIISLILQDHKPLKKLIKIMKDTDAEFAERSAAFKDFAPALLAHAKPEEQILYNVMKQNRDLREMGFEGEVEHKLADQMIQECKNTTNEDQLSAKIKILAELVENHIEEEEKAFLPDFKKHSELSERSQMGEKYLHLKGNFANTVGDKFDSEDEREEDLH